MLYLFKQDIVLLVLLSLSDMLIPCRDRPQYLNVSIHNGKIYENPRGMSSSDNICDANVMLKILCIDHFLPNPQYHCE